MVSNVNVGIFEIVSVEGREEIHGLQISKDGAVKKELFSPPVFL